MCKIITFKVIIQNISIYILIFTVIIMNAHKSNAYTEMQYTNPSEINGLIDLLDSTDENDRADAAFKLGKLRIEDCTQKVINALIKALSDPSNEVKISAITSLGKCKNEQAIPYLVNNLKSHDKDILIFSIQSIGLIGTTSDEVVDKLTELLENKSPKIREVTAKSLGRIGKGVEYAVQVMIRDLTIENKYKKIESARALEIIGPKAYPAVEPLTKMLSDTDRDVVLSACRALLSIKTQDALNAVEKYKENCSDVINEKIECPSDKLEMEKIQSRTKNEKVEK